MLVPEIEIRRPQRVAAVLLLLFAAQCFWAAAHRPLTDRDFHYAHCGRDLWEGQSPGSTPPGQSVTVDSCARVSDGVFAYLAAGLPLKLASLIEEGVSEEGSSTSQPGASQPPITRSSTARPPLSSRNPASAISSFFSPPFSIDRSAASVRRASGPSLGSSPWGALVLLRLPFIFFGIWLGGGLWWVSRRLYGNEGGCIALVLYCFSPEIIRHCVEPNNEILAAWGTYGVVFTGIGLAHAMQGPVRKWRPRLILLAVALGLTAAAHNVAAVLALLLTIGFMLYLAERRRPQTLPVLAAAAAGAFVIVLACYGFHPGALGFGPRGVDAFLRVSWTGTRRMFSALPNAGISIAAAAAIVVYLIDRRARYFGNTTPLIAAAVLLSLAAAGIGAAPWIWALPFVLTFIGGVFADGLESRYRPAFLPLAGALVVAQVVLSVIQLPGIEL